MVLILTQVVAAFDKGHRPIWSNNVWELAESHVEALRILHSMLPLDDESIWELEKKKGGEYWYYRDDEPVKRAKMILLK